MAFLVAAVAAIGAAVGTAATVAAVAVVVSEVGVALTVIGAVTGDKDLMKLGGVLGLAGGVGGLAAGAFGAAGGVAAEGAAVAGGASAADAATAAATDAGTAAVQQDATGALADSATSGLEGGVIASPVPDPGIAASPTNSLSDPTSSLAQQSANPATNSIIATPTATPASDSLTVQTPDAPSGIQTLAGAPDTATPYSNPTDMRLANGTQTAPTDSTDQFFTQFQNFFKNNKTLVDAGGKVIGGALNGINQSSIQAQQNFLAQQKIDIEKARTGLVSFGNTTANWSPRGIISGARP